MKWSTLFQLIVLIDGIGNGLEDVAIINLEQFEAKDKGFLSVRNIWGLQYIGARLQYIGAPKCY